MGTIAWVVECRRSPRCEWRVYHTRDWSRRRARIAAADLTEFHKLEGWEFRATAYRSIGRA